MSIRVNIGCGNTPHEGWVNFDNSPAIKLANSPILYFLAKLLKLLSKEQIKNVEWNKKNKIIFADAAKKLPLSNNSVECIYSSHMVEHLSRKQVLIFLREASRILKSDGILRIAVPDLQIVANKYFAEGDADSFMEEILVEAPPINSLKEKLILLITGYRHHQWMYDGKSITLLLKNAGFKNVRVLAKGETLIKNSNGLDLYERCESSVYVEGTK